MVAQKLETDLAVIQRKRAELEALEAQYAKDLEEARAVQEGDASQIAELEARRRPRCAHPFVPLWSEWTLAA